MSQPLSLPRPAGGDQNLGPTVEIVTWLFNLAYTILIVVAVNAGNGRHTYYLQPQQISDALRWNTIAFIPGIMAFSLPKLGVAILLMRLLNPTFSASTDAYLAAYPCTVLYKLNISKKKKIGLTAVLGLGLVAAVLAIYKCTRLPGLYNHSDYTYSTVDLLIWTSIESSFIIIAADLPTLRPIFQVLAGHPVITPRRFGGQRRSSYKLGSVSGDSGSRRKRGPPREQYPTDTIDLVREESAERILPSNRIRKTMDVDVHHHEGDQPGNMAASLHKVGEV
ncbi:MAG: hypothetical protein Q9191_005114 [Dirinaria sp. TL-2023a]